MSMPPEPFYKLRVPSQPIPAGDKKPIPTKDGKCGISIFNPNNVVGTIEFDTPDGNHYILPYPPIVYCCFDFDGNDVLITNNVPTAAEPEDGLIYVGIYLNETIVIPEVD